MAFTKIKSTNINATIIDLNSNFTSGTPTENAGVRVIRGSNTSVQIRWNETSDQWEFTNDGTVYTAIGAGSGDKGDKGDKGDTGTTGDKGEAGVAGDKGDKGDIGTTGDKGEAGTTGAKGDKGDVGTKGDKGDIGTTGDKGDKGEAGTTGAKGDKGDAGDKGDTGDKGDKGDIGTTGDKGDTGSAGVKGDKGDKGDVGTKGDKGDIGVTGDKGDKGDASTVAGPTGDKGDVGTKGDKGDIGTTGDKGDKGDIGTTGDKGDKGDASTVAGPTGDKGDKGDTGVTGDKGNKGDTLGLVASNYLVQGYKTSNQAITPGSDNLISFVDDYDPQNWWDTGTNRFTPNVAGYYQITLNVWFDKATGTVNQYNIQARKNGAGTTITQEPYSVAVGQTLNFTRTFYLNGSTDYIDFTAYNASGSSVDILSGSGTWFTATLIAYGAGAKGDKGDQGDKGDLGDKGDKGDLGTTGDKGNKGDVADLSGVSNTAVVYTDSTVANGSATFTYDKTTDLLSANNVTINGLLTSGKSTEILSSLTGATGTVTHNYNTSPIFYHTSPAANFTANITNVPTVNDRTIVVSIIVEQGATPYFPNALEIDGNAQTIKWAGGAAPTATASQVEIYSFSLIRISSTWTVLGQKASYA